MVLYRKLHTARARELRANMTEAEQKLWSRLRETTSVGPRFRRQVPLDRYIVDFACLSARLVVEVDGGQHFTEDGLAADAARDAWLAGEGFRILRFSNHDVLTNVDGVVETILAGLLPVPPPQPLPARGRG